MKLVLNKKVKSKILIATIFLFTILTILTPAVLAEPPLNTGFDEWGYNYQAHIFNGWYLNAGENRPDPPYEGTWGAPDETWVQMKWNDAWLSNKDRDGDGDLDRHWDYPTYIDSGAWLTNHMIGWYEDENGVIHQWEYFVKIIAPDYIPVDADPADGIDDSSGASIIWGSFLVIQRVYNDPYFGDHGIEELENPAGFGAW